MSQIVNVPISHIDSNPSRLLKKYPYVESKLEALKRSMQHDDIGCWEGIIARKDGDRYQIAFGHHRVKAAKDIGLKEIPLIVRKLTDRQMVQFMGRENLDDYTASFPVLLETWEAAEKFLSSMEDRSIQAIDIARLLGWVRLKDGYERPTILADACNAAHKLIKAGYLDREALAGVSVASGREVVERAHARMEQLDRLAEKQNRPKHEIERAKQHIAKGAKETIRQIKGGSVARNDIRGQLDVNSYRYAKEAKKISPLFDAFGKALADGISRMLKDDSSATKLQSVIDALDKIELDSDKQILDRIAFEVHGLEERTHRWHGRLTKKPATVSKFKLLSGE